MSRLALIVAYAGADSLPDALRSWGYAQRNPAWMSYWQSEEHGDLGVFDGEAGMLQAYQRAYECLLPKHEILAHTHDDLLLTEPYAPVWKRVMAEFDDPTVGVVGFGGALVHGSLDLYRTPFCVQQLGRSYYLSNTEDAEIHGARFGGECDVATLDGFALIVCRGLLEQVGGWPVGTPINYVGYDYWLTCVAHRLGYRVRLVGAKCLHLGGRTSVAQKRIPKDGAGHYEAHRYLWETYPDVLPWDCRAKFPSPGREV